MPTGRPFKEDPHGTVDTQFTLEDLHKISLRKGGGLWIYLKSRGVISSMLRHSEWGIHLQTLALRAGGVQVPEGKA